jgi:hypothetical protein
MALYLSHDEDTSDPLGPARGTLTGTLIGIVFWVVVILAVIG